MTQLFALKKRQGFFFTLWLLCTKKIIQGDLHNAVYIEELIYLTRPMNPGELFSDDQFLKEV
jgi:hypothetical protein